MIAQTYQAQQSAVETMIRGMSWVSPETPPTHEAPEDAEFCHAFRSTMGEVLAVAHWELGILLAHNARFLDRVTFQPDGYLPMVTWEVRLAQR